MSDFNTPPSSDDKDGSWLPRGQVVTHKLPVIGERKPPVEAHDRDGWTVEVCGCVDRPKVWTWAELMALGTEERVADIHCVTGWSRAGARWGGVPLRALLDVAGVQAEAAFVRFEARSPRRHDTSLALEVAREDTWLAHSFNGAPLALEHGGPLRTVTPSRWFYKSLKWVARVEVLGEDRLGFWERTSGYHNRADPFAEPAERYVFGDLSVPMLARLRKGRSLDRWRGKVVLGADLSGWDPKGRDLRGLALKSCELSGARLAGVDLRGANLTRSRFAGADLSGADLRDADLEGADLAGADLTGADLTGALLTAARFFERYDAERDEAVAPARVEGLRWRGAQHVFEDVAAFLSARAGDAP